MYTMCILYRKICLSYDKDMTRINLGILMLWPQFRYYLIEVTATVISA